jgi:hypothetical protein
MCFQQIESRLAGIHIEKMPSVISRNPNVHPFFAYYQDKSSRFSSNSRIKIFLSQLW